MIVNVFGKNLVIADNPCSSDSQCLAHRECMFGTIDKYNSLFNYMIDTTGCTDCNTRCTNCVCGNGTSAIFTNITNKLFCDANPICSNPKAHAVMNYPTDNLECEDPFRTMQREFIRLCGSVGGVCCDGNCTEPYDINQPRMPCEGKAAAHPHTRWIISAYLVSSIILAQWGFSSRAFV